MLTKAADAYEREVENQGEGLYLHDRTSDDPGHGRGSGLYCHLHSSAHL